MLNIPTLFQSHLEMQHELFGKYINPQMVKVLKAIGFDQRYVRGAGAYLYNDKGERYLDCLGGYGVFNMGRSHPKIKAALKEAIDADLPSLVQMDATLLAGLLAEQLLAKMPAGIDTVFFTNSGTEAVEGAIKFAKKATGKPRIL